MQSRGVEAEAPADNTHDAGGGAGNREILQAIRELKQEIADLRDAEKKAADAPADYSPHEAAMLRTELRALSESIHETKKEIAALRKPSNNDDQLDAMTHQLDAIVAATESATETILESAEAIDGNVGKLMNQASGPDETGPLEDIGEQVVKIFEACNFQDITGQRVTKVVNTLKAVEDRVIRMMDMPGGIEAFRDLVPVETPLEDADKALLHGPQLAGKGISQNDIDKLFD